ncbi:hypothetical protein FHS95_000140 [Sphingomonas naasensis]|uniref:Peptidase n=1 Tax=Sphingomonas naasensis TaxID=1344951 RepID=A0A4S1WQV2_9SPHN|nr:hypothetical protein [Sphingomonas naasensis]NIJ18471.1 hypothetical protein [Sphingomonas naasensis]TGX45731.1 hypothetical protein E5A74_00680 [Sphingomonas naasensis]
MQIPRTNPLNADRLRMTPLERAMGRFMRSPEGHDAGAGNAAGDADATDSAAEGKTDGNAVGAGDDDASVLGGAGEGGEGEKGEADKGEGGESSDKGADPGPPEKYELTAPEGFTLDAESLAEAEPIFRELNLSNDQAQKLMPAAAKFAERIVAQQQVGLQQQAANQRREWADAFAADRDIGGANKDATVAAAARAFDHYGLKKGEGLRLFLDESGLGNHPDLIRFVAGVGRDLAEGSFERGDVAVVPKAPEQKLYGQEFQPKT